jgi:nucleotide-binding universal stress UspA family protein
MTATLAVIESVEGQMTYVVVGIDGSSSSQAALRFAAEEARLHGADLRVVSAWSMPVAVYPAVNYISTVDIDTLSRYARDIAEKEIDDVLGQDNDVSVDLVVREGSAPAVLLEESRDAAMLVLGSRGHGGFVGLLLGSASQQCAAHARCPVTIVHEPASNDGQAQ